MPSHPARNLAPVLEQHAIANRDPVLAFLLDEALTGHVVASTRSTYASATKRWVRFCEERSVQPFPADPVWICAWVIDVTSSIKVSSLRMYLAGVKYTQILRGFEWTLSGNELLRRTIRYVRRVHGEPQKAAKLPVTYAVLRTILPLLPGWPRCDMMSHDDRLFAVASIIGVAGFLRGGEFLTQPRSSREVLSGANVAIELVNGAPVVVVYVPRPKNQWWESAVRVPCFSADPDGLMDPCRLLRDYRRLSPVRLRNADAALRKSNGATLDRDFMVKMTARLTAQAGITVLGPNGQAAPVKASSWRAGAVRSAIDGNVSDAMIMAMGRWRSIAWERYLLHSVTSLQNASRAMWSGGHGGSRVVASFRSSSMEASEEQEAMRESQDLVMMSASNSSERRSQFSRSLRRAMG